MQLIFMLHEWKDYIRTRIRQCVKKMATREKTLRKSSCKMQDCDTLQFSNIWKKMNLSKDKGIRIVHTLKKKMSSFKNEWKTNKILDFGVATFMSVMMYVSYFPQIMDSLVQGTLFKPHCHDHQYVLGSTVLRSEYYNICTKDILVILAIEHI